MKILIYLLGVDVVIFVVVAAAVVALSVALLLQYHPQIENM